MSYDMKYLAIPLPKEINVLKQGGQIEEALKRINLMLERDLNAALRRRLEIEKQILPLIPEQYPYTRDEALEVIRKDLPEFVAKNFDVWEEKGMVDYVLLDGTKHYFKRFWQTLLAVYPEISSLLPADEEKKQRTAQRKEIVSSMIESGQSAYRIRIRASLKVNDYDFHPGNICVHLPVPKPSLPTEHISIRTTSHADFTLASENAPSRTICFSHIVKENKTFFVEYEYDSHCVYQNPNPADVSSYQPEFHTRERLPHIRFTPYLRSLAREIIQDETNPLKKARAIYNYITTKIIYSYMPSYAILNDIAESCAVSGKGDCGVQALLFVTLCRYVGIPARFQSGLYVIPGDPGCHDWAQFYVAPFGWLHADLSFGGSAYREHDKKLHDFYFGNVDPLRMVANTAFQADFYPEKTGMRADPYDNQTGEAELNGVGLLSDQFETKIELLDFQKILR